MAKFFNRGIEEIVLNRPCETVSDSNKGGTVYTSPAWRMNVMLDLQECSRLLLNSILGGFRFGAWPFRRFKYRFPEKERRDQGISARHAFERFPSKMGT